MSDDPLIDNFRLDNCVATGGSSQIWEVFDQETNERYAMKLLLEEAFQDSEQKSILKSEYKIANAFDHPNIIRTFSHVQTKKHAYMIMEYFAAPNLKQIVRGDLSVTHTRFRKMTECLLMALGHVHDQGWLHRDIKPDNILMSKATDVRLIDFSLSAKIPSGLSKMLGGKSKVIQGTRTYIAPEIIRRKPACIQSDLYSLGVTLFECLTGRPPFSGTNPNALLMNHIQEPPPEPSAFMPNITKDMDRFILRLLAKKPENRHEDTSEVLSEFRSVKIFEQDPAEFFAEKIAKEKEEMEASVANVLDSRTDAERSTRQKEDGLPSEPSEKPKSTPASQQKKPATKAPAEPPGQPHRPPQQPQYQGQPPQGQYSQQPYGHYPQGQPMPGYPQMPPGQYPQQPMPPGTPPQQQPQYQPPQGQPGQGQPNQGQPNQGQPQRPAQQPPQQQRPSQQAPPKQQPSQPKPASPKQSKPDDMDVEDMPFADELPDFS